MFIVKTSPSPHAITVPKLLNSQKSDFTIDKKGENEFLASTRSDAKLCQQCRHGTLSAHVAQIPWRTWS
jgi:hypothetical protein